MKKPEFDFDTWFGVLQTNIADRCGVDFRDQDSVRPDYDDGRDLVDHVVDIAAEYGES